MGALICIQPDDTTIPPLIGFKYITSELWYYFTLFLSQCSVNYQMHPAELRQCQPLALIMKLVKDTDRGKVNFKSRG